MLNLEYFKKEIIPYLKKYDLKYKFFDEGDFGSLNQIEFNSEVIGGNIDFWSRGWLGIFIWDFINDEEILNVLIDPSEEKKRADMLLKIKKIL